MTNIRYNKKYRRKNRSTKVPENLFTSSDDTIELSRILELSEKNKEHESIRTISKDQNKEQGLIERICKEENTFSISDDSYEISDTEIKLNEEIKPSTKYKSNISEKKHISIKGTFIILNILELEYEKDIFISKLKYLLTIHPNLEDLKHLKLTNYDIGNEIKENKLVIFTSQHILLVSGEWKSMLFEINQEYELFYCNLCEIHQKIDDIKNITYLGANRTLIEITDQTPHFLIHKSNYITVTNLIKYIDCIYTPINQQRVMNWPHIDSNNFQKLNYSALIGNCSHKIIQSRDSLDSILISCTNNLLTHFVVNNCTTENYMSTLLELKKILHEFYTIQFTTKPEICEKKFICHKLNLVFIIDMIFSNEIVELKSGLKNFKDILQVLYYFISIDYDKVRREPKLIYFNDFLRVSEPLKKIDVSDMKTVNFSHALFQSMIIKRNIIGLLEKRKMCLDYEKCTCFYNNTICNQIKSMFNNKLSEIHSLFIKYMWKCFDIEEAEETKPYDVSKDFVLHITYKEYLKTFGDNNTGEQMNISINTELSVDTLEDNIKDISVLGFKNIDETKYQIIDLIINNIRISKGFFLLQKNGLSFYKLNTCLTSVPFTTDIQLNDLIGTEISFLSSIRTLNPYMNLKINNLLNIKFSKSTETYKIQRFGLLRAFDCELFSYEKILAYIKKYVIHNKQILSILEFEERDSLLKYVRKCSISEDKASSVEFENVSDNYDWSEVNHSNGVQKVFDELYIPQKFLTEYNTLNESQKTALMECLKQKNTKNKITGIHGMPGTGKTRLLVLLIKILHYHSKKVLVLTFTNRSLENIKNKLSGSENISKNSINIINTYQTGKTLKRLKKVHTSVETVILEFLKYKTKDTIIFSNINNLSDPIMADIQTNKYDYLVIDEAGQLPLSYFLCLYNFCDRVVAVGDHLQLKPVSIYNTSISVLQWIETDLKIILDIQYRMDLSIMKLANLLFYNGGLIHYKHVDKNTKLNIVENSIDIIDGKIEIDNMFSNLLKIIKPLEKFKILCFFNKTKDELRKKFHKHFKKSNKGILNNINQLSENKHDLEYISARHDIIETIDRFQGSEENIIILLLDSNEINEINSCRLRVNVAITRAKHKLIVYGDVGKFNDNRKNLVCGEYNLCREVNIKCINCINKDNYSSISNIPNVILDLLSAINFLKK